MPRTQHAATTRRIRTTRTECTMPDEQLIFATDKVFSEFRNYQQVVMATEPAQSTTSNVRRCAHAKADHDGCCSCCFDTAV